MKFKSITSEDGLHPEDFCAVKKCDLESTVIWLNIPFCDIHWIKHCEEEENAPRDQSKTMVSIPNQIFERDPEFPILDGTLSGPDLANDIGDMGENDR